MNDRRTLSIAKPGTITGLINPYGFCSILVQTGLLNPGFVPSGVPGKGTLGLSETLLAAFFKGLNTSPLEGHDTCILDAKDYE